MKKEPRTIKELFEEFAKHSQEYYNPRDDARRGKGDGGNDKLDSVIAKLDSMDRRMTKLDQSIHAIRVRCDNCNGPHLTKDCDLDKNRNKKAQVLY